MTYEDCRGWFERQLKERWNMLYDDEREIYQTAISAIGDAIAAREREEMDDITRCKICQTERSGEGYGDCVPPEIGSDDICDRCEIAKRIRNVAKGKDAQNS